MFLNKYTLSYPLCLIGIVLMISGFRWLINPEPWMLDEVANVERLGMTFETLFEPEINASLPGYLTQIYRFFGFWVLIIGLFIFNFSTPQIISSHKIASKVLGITGFLIVFGLYLSYTFIPSSHFIYLIWFALILYLLSLYSFIKISKKR
tara:strand:+ start:9439 stop:9888 length:450 start_codon:yes stop_codon:yes gene_type:complete